MKKCNGCGKWWNENGRRMLSGAYAPPSIASKKCKSSGHQAADCCTTHPGDYCRNCNKGGR